MTVGFIGTPGDMVNVRMQNDVKLPPDQRRKYVYTHTLKRISSALKMHIHSNNISI